MEHLFHFGTRRVSEGPHPKLNNVLNAGVPAQEGTEHPTVEIHRTGTEGREEMTVFVLQMGNYKVWRHVLCFSLEKTWA